MATVRNPPDQRLLLYGVSWQEYGRTLRAFAERPSLRVTYDRGVLELMTLSLEHEAIVRFFSLLILALTLELGLPLKGGGSTTFRKRGRRRGLEPDECYWIASESLVRGKDKIDLRRDPPPDLALEVDISYSTLDRMTIYAALRVPEIWRYDGRALDFWVLGPDGRYAAAARSKAMPQVASADLTGLLALRGTMDENALFRHFQAWAR
ncbi:MAG TPA: Uma2 family endonuclease, partial [Gemmataceae bacterium]|nr:Uma2 family endonuclease [Gemmataceae bacterium]